MYIIEYKDNLLINCYDIVQSFMQKSMTQISDDDKITLSDEKRIIIGFIRPFIPQPTQVEG